MVRFECIFGDRASTFGVIFALISRSNKLPVELGPIRSRGAACFSVMLISGRLFGAEGGRDSVGAHNANREQVPVRTFVALGVTPQ
jgi:hypothetical protein